MHLEKEQDAVGAENTDFRHSQRTMPEFTDYRVALGVNDVSRAQDAAQFRVQSLYVRAQGAGADFPRPRPQLLGRCTNQSLGAERSQVLHCEHALCSRTFCCAGGGLHRHCGGLVCDVLVHCGGGAAKRVLQYAGEVVAAGQWDMQRWCCG